jgi:hypothetical protein
MWRRTTTISALALLACAAPVYADGGGGAAYPGRPAGGTPTTTPLPPERETPESPPAAAPLGMLRLVNGRAVAPRGTPRIVRRMIVAANRLVRKRYRWGGGHRDFTRGLDRGYDCSGAVSYTLYGGRLLLSPLDSSGLARFGERGPGTWVTIYANRGHTYLVIAGLRFDTGAHDAFTTPLGTGPRWSTTMRSPRRFKVRHPVGL